MVGSGRYLHYLDLDLYLDIYLDINPEYAFFYVQ